ncbi:MAG: adenylate kinase [Opitutales bacterium]
MKNANIIFLGAPGSGKGTRASVMGEVLSIPQISTGDIFRANIKNSTPLGLEAKGYTEAGKLVPDELTAKMVKDRLLLDDCQNGFILDGFPRTLVQAEMLDEMLKEMNKSISYAMYLDVANEEIMKRLTGRRTCPKCQASYHIEYKPSKEGENCELCHETLAIRPDDNPETIKTRLEIYDSTTKPLIDYYAAQEKLYKISGDVDMSKLQEYITEVVKELDLA